MGRNHKRFRPFCSAVEETLKKAYEKVGDGNIKLLKVRVLFEIIGIIDVYKASCIQGGKFGWRGNLQC